MRQALNFRFSPKSVHTLIQLENELHLSRTAILEEALQLLAKKRLSAEPHPLLTFAGKLNEKEADTMLKNIKNSRRNKRKSIKL